MNSLMKSAVLASGLVLSSAALASAGSINLSISNSSSQTISFYGAPSCTNCTTPQIAFDIQPSASKTSRADSSADAPSMTYTISYYGTYKSGTRWVQKGCRAVITALVTEGKITSVTSAGWAPFTGNPSCTTISNPQIDSLGNVNWAVDLYAY